MQMQYHEYIVTNNFDGNVQKKVHQSIRRQILVKI